jgi:hypothetical protein
MTKRPKPTRGKQARGSGRPTRRDRCSAGADRGGITRRTISLPRPPRICPPGVWLPEVIR